ncbi:hypothetical protein KHM83_17205 [Fusibacter paucivorans]|uniref:DUF1292 domain-containing protein n=1 Tax=Fusibacter paucivorans TaxID=76009 RepID=A0ABS5PTC6_9FIRM|nr:hypothetical protein [Fusibacter paucivorans]MBS7528428.1 hypothetical protein [Fusibacter paucivorans]
MTNPELAPEVIEAEQVTIEIIDKTTGRAYKREVPLSYKENDNGIILIGENAEGQTSEIVFLSSIALSKLKDLMGKGPDQSDCDDHDHHHDHDHEHDHGVELDLDFSMQSL